MNLRLFVLTLIGSLSLSAGALAVESKSLRGIVVDDSAATLTGSWTKSTSVKPYVDDGYIHDENTDKGSKSVRFEVAVPAAGEYHVLIGYTSGSNRDTKVPVTVQSANGKKTIHLDQSKKPSWADGFEPIGTFTFTKEDRAAIIISNDGTKQHVIADAVRLVKTDEFELAKKEAGAKAKVAAKPTPKAKPIPVNVPEFVRTKPTKAVTKLSSAELDTLLRAEVPQIANAEQTTDEAFIRRVSLDLVGRPPTLEEFERFVASNSADKRSALIDELLSSDEFGRNWANYWSDSIGARQQEPELTFHDYGPLKSWLAEQFNSGKGWDETVYQMLTAVGKVGDNPAATFIGFHQGNGHRLAGETTRVFLSQQIHCAECHDHPFVDMPQETFHGMAAFFARTDAKIAQLNSNGIEVKSKDKGEQRISGRKEDMPPTNLAGKAVELGTSDIDRRIALGNWLVSGDNPDFARAYVNRIWARLLGRGFAEPVDDFGELATVKLPSLLEAVADHFVASDFDHRAVFSLIMNSDAYQRKLSAEQSKIAFATLGTKPLRGDEVFESLAVAIALEDIEPPREKKTAAVRFPPPAKSTRDLINEAFGYDPSFDQSFILRTMKQAMFMMNNPQLADAIAADDNEKFLARLLAEESDDAKALGKIYRRILARAPTENEMKILRKHIDAVPTREAAFEDIVWSLINSAEFTVRK